MNKTARHRHGILYQRYKKDVEQAKRTAETVLRQLQEEGYIQKFHLTSKHVNAGKALCNVTYQCLPTFTDTYVTIRINFALSSHAVEDMNFYETSRLIHMEVHPNEGQVVYQRTKTHLLGWKRGIEHERLFKNFLDSLVCKYPALILSVATADKHSDCCMGIDFIVECNLGPPAEVCVVSFNLKSSQNFLDRHITLYPDVSTFVFTENDLLYRTELERNFFAFLLAASAWTVHY